MKGAATRLADFRRRCSHSDHVESDAKRGWTYLPVHPCADEAGVLAALELSPSDCTSVDLWWSDGTDVALVQIVVSGTPLAPLQLGLHARLADGEGYAFNVVAVVDVPQVRTTDVQRVLGACARLDLTGDAFSSVVGLDGALRWFGAIPRRLSPSPEDA